MNQGTKDQRDNKPNTFDRIVGMMAAFTEMYGQKRMGFLLRKAALDDLVDDLIPCDGATAIVFDGDLWLGGCRLVLIPGHGPNYVVADDAEWPSGRLIEDLENRDRIEFYTRGCSQPETSDA